MSKPPLEIHRLRGSRPEAFYQLGLKDREIYRPILDQIHQFITTGSQLIDQGIELYAKKIVRNVLKNHPEFEELLTQYSRGLGAPFSEVAMGMLIPEIVSFMSRWAPGLPSGLLGCSSWFVKDQKSKDLLHGRVLDFPLGGIYDQQERCLAIDFGKNKVFSLGSAGIPFPSITAFNDQGVTFALHQKFTKEYHPEGKPIFLIALNLLEQCSNVDQALSFLKNQISMTTWSFYLGFKSGDILACDLRGEQFDYQHYLLEDDQFLYFNNQLINKDIEQKDFIPYGFSEYNSKRCETAISKIEAFQKSKKKINEIELLKLVTTPTRQYLKKPQKWSFDCITSSSVSVSVINGNKGTLLTNFGDAPKFFNGKVLKVNSPWKKQRNEIENLEVKTTDFDPRYHLAVQGWMKAQVAWDRQDFHEAFHQLQMAKVRFPVNSAEAGITQFYFCVYQYIHIKNDHERVHLRDEFLQLEPFLQDYFKDQCRLFILRLEREQELKESFNLGDIQHPHLRQTWRLEKRIPKAILKATIPKLIVPRIDVFDVITSHIKG